MLGIAFAVLGEHGMIKIEISAGGCNRLSSRVAEQSSSSVVDLARGAGRTLAVGITFDVAVCCMWLC